MLSQTMGLTSRTMHSADQLSMALGSQKKKYSAMMHADFWHNLREIRLLCLQIRSTVVCTLPCTLSYPVSRVVLYKNFAFAFFFLDKIASERQSYGLELCGNNDAITLARASCSCFIFVRI